MNKVYRTVFNEKTNTWVAVAETAKAHGKSSRSSIVEGGGVLSGGATFNLKAIALSLSIAGIFLVSSNAYATVVVNDGNLDIGDRVTPITTHSSYKDPNGNRYQFSNSIRMGVGKTLDAANNKDASIAIGVDTVSSALRTIAMGWGADASGADADEAIAIGVKSQSSGRQSVALGSATQATGNQSTAIGNNTIASGNSSVAIGGDDLNKVSQDAAGNWNQSATALKYKQLTGDDLIQDPVNKRYISTEAGNAAVAVGVQSFAKGDLATTFGTRSSANAAAAVALGAGSDASKENSVALGAGSTTATNATKVLKATVGSITYGDDTGNAFAGGKAIEAGDQVSVGTKDYERQIKHVAPGAIDKDSTDAINGSQLFYVTQGLQNQIGSLGFGVNADNNSLKTHQLGKELAIVAGNTTETTSTSNLKTNVTQDAVTGKTTVTVSMKEAPAFSSVTTQDAAGNKTVTNAGGVTITPVSGSPVSLTKDGLNNGGNKITGVADGNIAAGSKEAVNGGQLHDLKENGFKIAADNGTPDTVKLTETVKYAGDSNIVTTVKDNEIGFKLADSITVGPATGGHPVKIDGNDGTVTGLTNKTWDPNNITSGRGATEDQLKAAVATTPLTVANDGKVTPPAAADAGKLATAGDIANAINNSGFQATAGGNLASGTTATATTVKPGQKVTFAAGNGLTVKQDVDGTSGDQTYTYALDAQTVVQNAQTPVVYTKADGTKVYKHTDGNFYDAPNGAGNQVAAGDVIASMQDAAGNTTAPTTLANVKSNLADAATATTNPANNDRAALTANNKGNNAATVNDVLNAGFTVQGNGQDKDFVTHGDTVNFANGQGTVANVTSTNGVTTVKFDTPMTYADASGNPTSTPSNKVNLVGGTAGSPVTLGNVADGNIAAGSKEAVNGGQLHATNQNVANNATNIAKGINFGGTTGSNNYRLGDTIRVKGDSNITSTTVAGGAQLALNPNLNVTSVTATDAAGNKTVTNGSGVTITPAAGNPVSLTTGGLNNGGNKITNVAEGTAGTDAVNVSQLNQAIGAIAGPNTANFTALNNKVNEVAADAKAGTAAAMAVAGLPQAYLPGKSMMAVGGSVYRGESGYAIGYSTISDGGNWIIKGTATGNSRGHYGATAAVGYQW